MRLVSKRLDEDVKSLQAHAEKRGAQIRELVALGELLAFSSFGMVVTALVTPGQLDFDGLGPWQGPLEFLLFDVLCALEHLRAVRTLHKLNGLSSTETSSRRQSTHGAFTL
jgi:hypothetical protein